MECSPWKINFSKFLITRTKSCFPYLINSTFLSLVPSTNFGFCLRFEKLGVYCTSIPEFKRIQKHIMEKYEVRVQPNVWFFNNSREEDCYSVIAVCNCCTQPSWLWDTWIQKLCLKRSCRCVTFWAEGCLLILFNFKVVLIASYTSSHTLQILSSDAQPLLHVG